MVPTTLTLLTPLIYSTLTNAFPLNSKPLRHARRQSGPNWTSLACYSDNVAARTLTGAELGSDSMTTSMCQAFCNSQGFKYAATEWSRECYCGNDFSNGGAPADSGCDMPCSGANGETCGGSVRLSVYENTGVLAPLQSNYPGWSSQGCHADSVANRALPNQVNVEGDMTVQKCTAQCFTQGFTYAGVEFGHECFCGSAIGASGTPATTGCDMPCTGNSNEICGGGDRLNVYQYNGAAPLPSTGDWVLEGTNGCHTDVVANRALGLRVYVDGAMTVPKCTAKCLSLNFGYAGVEFADECYCSSGIGSSGTATSDGCTMPCSGDISTICGGPDRLTVYKYQGTTLTTQPTVLDSYNSYTSQGCYTDSIHARIMTSMNVAGSMTVEKCIDACFAQEYDVAGVEFGGECYCTVGLPVDSFKATDNCNMPCAGDAAHLCGGADRLNVYRYQTPVTTTSTTTTSTTTTTTTTTTTSTTTAAETQGPTTVSVIPPQWDVVGCTKTLDRTKVISTYDLNNYPPKIFFPTTYAVCEALCIQDSWNFAVYIQGTVCNCVKAPVTETLTDGTCDTPCDTGKCGGANSYTVLSFTPPRNLDAIVPPAGWSYVGCTEQKNLATGPPNQSTWMTETSSLYESCASFCSPYTYAAVQDRNCFCYNGQNTATTFGSQRCYSQFGTNPLQISGTGFLERGGPTSWIVFKVKPTATPV